MKRILVLCCWLLVAVQAFAEERVALGPEGKIPDFQASQIAATTEEVKAPGFKAADHAMPYLDWYQAPADKNGGCMLLISGGGYQSCCDGVWIDRVAKKFTELGFVCASLNYRTPRPQGCRSTRGVEDVGTPSVLSATMRRKEDSTRRRSLSGSPRARTDGPARDERAHPGVRAGRRTRPASVPRKLGGADLHRLCSRMDLPAPTREGDRLT